MIENLLYTALATLLVIVLLHIGVFWVSRVIQPPKPRVVYMQSAPQQQQQQYNTLPPPLVQQQQLSVPPPPAPAAAVAAPEIKLPTYDTPPMNTKPASPLSSLPPPIETRDPARS